MGRRGEGQRVERRGGIRDRKENTSKWRRRRFRKLALNHFSVSLVTSPFGSLRECGRFEAHVEGMSGSSQHRLDPSTMLVVDVCFSIWLPGRGSQEGQQLRFTPRCLSTEHSRISAPGWEVTRPGEPRPQARVVPAPTGGQGCLWANHLDGKGTWMPLNHQIT